MSTVQARSPSSQTITLPAIPELFDPSFLDTLLPASKSGNTPKEHGTSRSPTSPSQNATSSGNRTVTNNGAAASKSTGSAILDAFIEFNARSRKALNGMDVVLTDSWVVDPELTLKTIWNVRSIHDGKGEKELFYRAFGWLYEHHPRTAISNLHMIVEPVCTVLKGELAPHGYWKDLLNILGLATCNELLDFHSRPSNFLRTYTPKSTAHRPFKYPPSNSEERSREGRKDKSRQYYDQLSIKLAEPKYRALYVAVVRLFADRLRQDALLLDELQSLDPKIEKERYRVLSRNISLAGKWAPTPGGAHDRVTNISTALCQVLFSPSENAGPGAIGPLPSAALHPISTDPDNCAVLRNYYHRWMLRPLREIIACPEPLMSANKWNEINYSRVPSICMARNKSHFINHDPEGFHLFLAEVKSKKKISGAVLMPHELVGEAIELQKAVAEAQQEEYPKVAEFKRMLTEQQLEVVDTQWRTLIWCLRETGIFESTLAVCDVSGSMGSIHEYDRQNVKPIFPSVALSLVLASVTKPPFNAGMITFSENPKFVRLEGLEERSLTDLVSEVLNTTESAGNTDLQAVFLDLLLPLAKENNIPREDMVKRIFVFSGVQFDHASGLVTGPWWLNRTLESERVDRWETSYDLIERVFHEAGYDVPEIVFWDLSGEKTVRQTVEVEGERRGVTMMNGFSSAMMKVFMGEEPVKEEEKWMEVTEDGEVYEADDDDEDEMTPVKMMMKTLSKKSYDGLVVVD